MKLVFLHGAPASGKLTVATALLQHVAGRLFDNHAAIDVARTVFAFGAPGFWELVHRIRVSVLEAAAEQDIPLVVTTLCYAEPDDRPQLEHFERIVQRRGGALLPVFLRCSHEALIRRVGNTDRIMRRKTASRKGLEEFLAHNPISPVPRANCLTLDSDMTSAEATARTIIRHFGLSARHK